MKKVLFLPIVLVLVLIVVMACVFFGYRSIALKEVARFEEIRKDFKSECETYMGIRYPVEYNEGKEAWLVDDYITDPKRRGASKDILLQYNGKDYCKAAAHGKVVNGSWEVEVFLKCETHYLLKTSKYKERGYDDAVEYMKCVTTLDDEYYDTNFEDYKCPEDKYNYLLNNSVYYMH